MRPNRAALLLVATLPATGVTQTPPGPASPPSAPVYRGFTAGISYREFVERARSLADSDVVRCQTSPHTAQVMECGVVIHGPNDASRFYLSAHFIVNWRGRGTARWVSIKLMDRDVMDRIARYAKTAKSRKS